MTRGFISGLFWGLVFAIGSLWVVSQLGGIVRLLTAPAEISEIAPDGGDGAAIEGAANANAPSVSNDATINTDLSVATPATPAIEGEPIADTSKPAQPATSDAGGLEQPTQVAENATLPTSQADGGVANEGTIQPQTPKVGDVPSVDETALPTSQAEVDEPVQAVEPVENVATPSAEEPQPSVDQTAQAPIEPTNEEAPVVDFSTPTVVETPSQTIVTEEEVLPVPTPTESETVQEAPSEPVVVVGEDGSIMQPVTSFADRDDEEVTQTTDETSTEENIVDPDLPAILRYARPFENPNNLPTLAVILVTDANGQIATSDAVLPITVNYAVNANDATANDLMQRIRAAGQEAIGIMPVPEAARASDVEVAFAAHLATLPEVVALMDVPQADFQSSRDIAAQVVAIAQGDGLGLIAYPRGLNSVIQMAERDNVAVGQVFREIDGGGSDRAAIKRFLDRAAFRAGQQKGVIVVGTDSAETIAALLEWTLGNRAETINLAPISAILTGQ